MLTKLCHEGVVSLYSFIAGLSLLLPFTVSDLLVWLELGPPLVSTNLPVRLLLLSLYFISLNVVLWLKTSGNNYQIAWRATLLGHVFSVSFTVFACGAENWRAFGIYGMFLSLFHYSEYLSIAFNNPKTLSVESFILNHSRAYHVAAFSSWLEFGLETAYFPGLKSCKWIWLLGTLICLGGELLRKLAMLHASYNFTHVVRYDPVENHRLVKSGVYAFTRHPSYVGWFYWSIGTQIILANPICLIMYTLVSWRFFNERVFMEEITLLNFFGEEYYRYQQKVPTGLPFIHGYKTKL